MWRAGLLVACLVALAGCGAKEQPAPLPSVGGGATSSTGSGTPSTTTTGSPSSPPPTPGVNRSDPVIVYRAWWAAVQSALATADPAAPGLALYAIDPLLANTRASIGRLRGQGIVQVVTFMLSPQVVTRQPDRVEITDCIRTPAGTYRDARTGQPRAPPGFRNDTSSRDSLRFVLRQRDSSWYLVATTALGGGSC
jgi:hypothetical protein